MKPRRVFNRSGIGTVAIIVIGLVLTSLVLFVAPIVIPNLFLAKKSADRALVQVSLRSAVAGLDLYRQVHGEYPLVLEDLLTPPDSKSRYVIPETLEIPGYQYEYTSLGDRYTMRLTPRSAAGPHYFVDESTVIRRALDAPADESSPELPGPTAE